MILHACVGLLACAAALPAQEVLWRRIGRPIGDPRGSQLLRFPLAFSDVNNDGWPDVACTTTSLDTLEHSILFLSGCDGSTIRESVDSSSFFYRTMVACGDVNLDGVEDYAVTREERGFNPIDNFIEVRSGVDDSILWSVQGPWAQGFGRMLLGRLDLNGDGRPDLLAIHQYNPGALEGFDHTGRSLFRMSIFAWRLGRIGDFDHDGCDDFLVGATDTVRQEGAVWLYSGRTQQVLQRGGGNVGNGTVLGIGDVDQDGVLDFAASNAGLFVAEAVVQVYSGRTGQPWLTWRDRPTGFGKTLAVCDFDQDGVLDLLMTAGDPTGTFGVIRAHSLRDGHEVGVLYPERPGTSFAVDFSAGAPQPMHPFPTVVVWDPEFNSSSWQVGQVGLIRTAPSSVRPLGPGCTSIPASLPRIGYGVEGQGTRLHVSGATPDALATLLIGLSSTSFGGMALPLPLDALGFVGCSLQTSIEASATTCTAAGLDRGSASFVVPRLPVALHGQWAVLDRRSAQLSMSGGLRW